MVQNETNLVVADNSGARSVRVFRLLGGSKRRASSVGDIVICAVIGVIRAAYLGICHLTGNSADIAGAAYLAVVCAVYDLAAGDDSRKAAVIAGAVYAHGAPAVDYFAGEGRSDARCIRAV